MKFIRHSPFIGHTNFVAAVTFSQCGRKIISGSHDQTVRKWCARTGRQLGEPIIGHKHFVTSEACSPNGKEIISGSYDKTIRRWDAKLGF